MIKDGDRRALAVDPDGAVVAEPALRVEVVEPVGAGDAFAAGLLTGVLRGEPVAALPAPRAPVGGRGAHRARRLGRRRRADRAATPCSTPRPTTGR